MPDIRTNTGSTTIHAGDVLIVDATANASVQASTSSGQAGFAGVALATAAPQQPVTVQTSGLAVVNVAGSPGVGTVLQPGLHGRAEVGHTAPAFETQGAVRNGRVLVDILGGAASTAAAIGSAPSLVDYLVAFGLPGIISGAPPAIANRGLLSMGSGTWAGATNDFAGSSLGTFLAVNAASGYTGNLLDYQVLGLSRFTVDGNGNVILSNAGGGNHLTWKLSSTQHNDIWATDSTALKFSAASAGGLLFWLYSNNAATLEGIMQWVSGSWVWYSAAGNAWMIANGAAGGDVGIWNLHLNGTDSTTSAIGGQYMANYPNAAQHGHVFWVGFGGTFVNAPALVTLNWTWDDNPILDVLQAGTGMGVDIQKQGAAVPALRVGGYLTNLAWSHQFYGGGKAILGYGAGITDAITFYSDRFGAVEFFGLEGVGGAGHGGGQGIISITNAWTNPTTNPSGGGILYADGGALKWRGPSGTVTTMGAA